MAGLVPAIHVFVWCGTYGADAHDKRKHPDANEIPCG
jgi:hypothetical protein